MVVVSLLEQLSQFLVWHLFSVPFQSLFKLIEPELVIGVKAKLLECLLEFFLGHVVIHLLADQLDELVEVEFVFVVLVAA